MSALWCFQRCSLKQIKTSTATHHLEDSRLWGATFISGKFSFNRLSLSEQKKKIMVHSHIAQHWQRYRDRQKMGCLEIRGGFRTVNTDSHWVLCKFISICACLGVCSGQCKYIRDKLKTSVLNIWLVHFSFFYE